MVLSYFSGMVIKLLLHLFAEHEQIFLFLVPRGKILIAASLPGIPTYDLQNPCRAEGLLTFCLSKKKFKIIKRAKS
jgi:hypothetical protein